MGSFPRPPTTPFCFACATPAYGRSPLLLCCCRRRRRPTAGALLPARKLHRYVIGPCGAAVLKVSGGRERLVQPAASVSVRWAVPPFRRRPATAADTATVRAAAADRPAGHGYHAPPLSPPLCRTRRTLVVAARAVSGSERRRCATASDGGGWGGLLGGQTGSRALGGWLLRQTCGERCGAREG